MSDVMNIEKTGIALFKNSTGTETVPLFETDERVVFNDEVHFDAAVDYSNTDWISMSLATNVSANSTLGAKTGGIFYRNEGGHVFICGCVSLTASTTGAQALTVAGALPTELCPHTKIFKLAPQDGHYVNFIELLENGVLYIARNYIVGNTAAQKATVQYIQLEIDYFI